MKRHRSPVRSEAHIKLNPFGSIGGSKPFDTMNENVFVEPTLWPRASFQVHQDKLLYERPPNTPATKDMQEFTDGVLLSRPLDPRKSLVVGQGSPQLVQEKVEGGGSRTPDRARGR